jgi:CBS domain-containing protein
VTALIVREIMNINVTRILIGATLRQAAEVSAISSAADLAVVDEANNFLGTLSEGDLMRAALPSLSDTMAGGETLSGNYDLIEEKAHEIAGNPIDPYVIRDPITLSPSDPVHKAAALMSAKQIRRLPVVEGGKLVGTVARADICRAVFR